MPENVTFWDRTKQYSSTAYNKALKPGFEKAYGVVNKLEAPVNKLSYKVGSESFWPGSLDKESNKAARILRGFCKDGIYDHIDEAAVQKAEIDGVTTEPKDIPQGTQRVIKKIPAKVIQNAKGLAIFTCMRTGWVIGGSGGAGILVGRHPETGEWSPPSGIHMQNLSVGFLIGVDLTDTVLVINSYEALEAFTKLRCTLGTEVAVAAGPLGIGGTLDTQVNKMPSPVWSYVKSRGFYGGVAVDGNVVIERTDENERFYGERVGVAKILLGEVRHPPTEKYQVLMDTIRAAQGENIDESLLPDGEAPSDFELASPGPTFGVPDGDDPDPFGYKALEAQGLSIREAGTHRRATPDSFEFKPSPTSPVYNTYRKSIDANLKKKEWRSSIASVVSTDRGTQTDEEDTKSPRLTDSPLRESDMHSHSPLRGSISSAADAGEKGERKLEDLETTRPQSSIKAVGLGINTHVDHVNDKHPSEGADDVVAATPKPQTQSDGTPKILVEKTPAHDNLSKTADHENGSVESQESSIHKILSDDSTNDADADTDSSDGEFSDMEDAEIITAVPVTAKPKAGVVNIPLRVPPALPPRNPSRHSRSLQSESATEDGFDEVTLVDDNKNISGMEEQSEKLKVSKQQDHENNADDVFHSTVATPLEEKTEKHAITAS